MPFIKRLLWGAVLFTPVLTAVSGRSNVPVFDIADEGPGPEVPPSASADGLAFADLVAVSAEGDGIGLAGRSNIPADDVLGPAIPTPDSADGRSNIPFDDVLGEIPNFVFPSVEASVTKIRRPTSIDRQALATDPSSTISKVDPTSVPGRSHITVDDILGEIPSSILQDVEEFVTKISTLTTAERQAIAINIVSTIMDVDNIPDFGNVDMPFDNVLGEIPDFVLPTPTTKVDTMVTESPSTLHHSHFLGFVTTFTKVTSSDAKVIPSKLPTLSGASFAPTEAVPSSLITASPILAGSTTFRKVRSVTSSRS
jgi:hypothetical protein